MSKQQLSHKTTYTDGWVSCPTEWPRLAAPDRFKIKSCIKCSIGTCKFSCLLRLLL